MCTLNAENSVQHGNHEGKGLNNGILYLLAMPYLAVAAIGIIWFKKYRRKDILVDIKDEKINLNWADYFKITEPRKLEMPFSTSLTRR